MKIIRSFFYVFNVFLKIQKNGTFYVFLSCCARFLEHCSGADGLCCAQDRAMHVQNVRYGLFALSVCLCLSAQKPKNF